MVDDGRIEPHQWVRTLATALGVPGPSQDEIDDLLSLAGTAAHTAERWVAPISTWLAARADLAPADARALVERLATAAAAVPPTSDDSETTS